MEFNPFRNQLIAMQATSSKRHFPSHTLYQTPFLRDGRTVMDATEFTPLCRRVPQSLFVWLMAEGNESGFSFLSRRNCFLFFFDSNFASIHKHIN